MASSLHQWESDPLFSAAEVIQDSADRMESLFRLLLHDQSLVQGDHTEPRLLTSVEYHKRDLATILETAKWQLEDFERAVNFSALQDKSRSREDVISRHQQFIRAIKEQINNVERNVDGLSMRDSMRNSEWVKLNEQDRDGLALFLMGGNATDNSNHYDKESTSILRRFLDSSSASGLKGDDIVEHENAEFKELKMKSNVSTGNCSLKEDCLRLGSDLKGISGNRHVDGNWDLEADEATPESVFVENQVRRAYSAVNVFRFWSNLRSMFGSKVSKSYIKRLKDGEEQRHSPKYINASHSEQGSYLGQTVGSKFRSLEGLCSRVRANLMVLGCLEARYRRFPCPLQVNRHTMQMIFTVVFAFLFLGILVSRIA